MFCENVVTLVGWICKSYGFVQYVLFILFLFFTFIFSQLSICALFSTIFFHCSYSVFHRSSTVPFWLATLSFFFFFWTVATVPSGYNRYFFFFSLLFVLYFPFFIYHCTSNVFALCVHYSCNSALVLCVLFLFFFYSTLLFIQLAL